MESTKRVTVCRTLDVPTFKARARAVRWSPARRHGRLMATRWLLASRCHDAVRQACGVLPLGSSLREMGSHVVASISSRAEIAASERRSSCLPSFLLRARFNPTKYCNGPRRLRRQQRRTAQVTRPLLKEMPCTMCSPQRATGDTADADLSHQASPNQPESFARPSRPLHLGPERWPECAFTLRRPARYARVSSGARVGYPSAASVPCADRV